MLRILTGIWETKKDISQLVKIIVIAPRFPGYSDSRTCSNSFIHDMKYFEVSLIHCCDCDRWKFRCERMINVQHKHNSQADCPKANY